MAGRGIVIETGMTSDELRARGHVEKSRRAGRRMQAIANEIDGYDREEAARLAGMSEQALRDAIKRFNAEGIEGRCPSPSSCPPRRSCHLLMTTKYEETAAG